VEAGNMYLPHVSICPWIDDWVEELAVFPNGPHDDRVDAFTQAMQRAQKMKKQLDLPPVESLTQKSMWSQGWDR
jgi:phage terminase large subunit-like protein